MKCGQARRLFGAYWDDEASQAEREWLESHFVGCASCRGEYERYSRVLEAVGSLPRAEAAPDLAERTLARARRLSPAPDRLPTAGLQWVPLTAAAALLIVLVSLVSPWLGLGPRVADRGREVASIPQPVLVQPAMPPGEDLPPADRHRPATTGLPAGDPLSAIPDSLFDHSEDVEFILDPITLRRGRATLSRAPGAVQGERAFITF